jgi:transposase
MRIRKITGSEETRNPAECIDHYVGVDWSERTMAVAHLGGDDVVPQVREYTADVVRLEQYLRSLNGSVALTFEESTPAHWLYGKLMPVVDRLIVCDPTYNRLLCRGPKNDTIDASKLCVLLRQGSLKEVYHSTSTLYQLRLLVSGYQDTIQAGVAAQNRLKAHLRARHSEGTAASVVIKQLEESIALYRKAKAEFEQEFQRWTKRTPLLRALAKLPGIGVRSAVKIMGIVVDARRFPDKQHYDSYCGLVWHQKRSGGRYYGRRRPAYNRTLKAVYKVAALAAIHGQNEFADYYHRLVDRGVATHNARHATARLLAHVSYGILKNGKPYDPKFRSMKEHNSSAMNQRP